MRWMALVATLFLAGGLALAETPPRIIATMPVDGSAGVPVNLGAIVLVFDRDMATGSHSLVKAATGDVPAIQGDVRWPNRRTVIIPLGRMEPGRTYGLGFNDAKHRGFRGASGAVLAPVALRFTTGTAPVVTHTQPKLGQVDVDPNLGEIIVEFSEDLVAGKLSLRRMDGLSPLGYRRDRRPSLKSARALAIPVQLQGGVTYGVVLDGFVSKATGKTFLPFQLVFTTGAPRKGGGPVGVWSWQSENGLNRMKITFQADGRYSYWSRMQGQEGSVSGTWRDEGSAVVIQPENGQAARLAYTRVDARTLDLKLGEGEPVRFKLQQQERKRSALAGTWTGGGITLVLTAEGRYTFTAPDESAKGTWRDLGGALEVTEDGGKTPLRVPYRFTGADTLELTVEGERIALSRKVAQRQAAEQMLFTRWRVVTIPLPGTDPYKLPAPELWTMNPDGTGARSYWEKQEQKTTPEGEVVSEPCWAAGFTHFVVSSNSNLASSALYTDVFVCDMSTMKVRRITGNSMAPKIEAKCKLRIDITGSLKKGTRYWLAAQGGLIDWKEGADGKEGEGYIMAGKRWVKCWLNRYRGDMKVLDFPANGNVAVKFDTSNGNLHAISPSISPDLKYVVCVSRKEGIGKNGPEYFDQMALVRVSDGQLLYLWKPTEHNGEFATFPRFSPDGQWVSFSKGRMTRESLVVCSTASLLQGKPDYKTVFQSRIDMHGGNIGAVRAAWSPDSRQLCFFAFRMASDIHGDLYIVNRDGSGLRQLTRSGVNELPVDPCWSPDGRSIAFAMMTSKGAKFDVLDLLRVNFSSDIWTIGIDGSGARRLTKDGRSGSPAWGRPRQAKPQSSSMRSPSSTKR